MATRARPRRRPRSAAATWGQELESLRQLVEKLQVDREADQAEIQRLRDSVQTLEDGQLRAYRGTGAGPAAGATSDQEIGTDKREDREYQRTERRVLEQRRGVLLPAGQLLFEPGFQYTNISRNRVQLSGFSLIPAIIIGRIDVVEIERDIFVGNLNTRYGIFDFLEAELSVPYVFRQDQEIFGATGLEQQVNVDGNGIRRSERRTVRPGPLREGMGSGYGAELPLQCAHRTGLHGHRSRR